MLEYRSISDMSGLIASQAEQFTGQWDLVVGIPRSGTLAAAIIAITANLPLTDLDSYVGGHETSYGKRVSGAGERRKGARQHGPNRRVLVVDDSMYTGEAIAEARRKIRIAGIADSVTYAVIYAHPRSVHNADLVLEKIGQRVFEWNIMNHALLGEACVDLDGVLCADPSEYENDDGTRYGEFLVNARPKFLPSMPIKCIVTGRLERYRAETTQWLLKHGIVYSELVMLQVNSKEERMSKNCHVQFKGGYYRGSDTRLFIESSVRQAPGIADLSDKPVYCVENREMYYGKRPEVVRRQEIVRDCAPGWLRAVTPRPIKSLVRRAVGGG